MRVLHLYMPDTADTSDFVPDRAGAKTLIKAMTPDARTAHVLDEIEVRTDKEGVVAALNGEPIFTVLRRFGITARGGLKEEAIE